LFAHRIGCLPIDTTRGYTAVFPEQVIAAHQHLSNATARLAEAKDREHTSQAGAAASVSSTTRVQVPA
jgi:hypothetical protein